MDYLNRILRSPDAADPLSADVGEEVKYLLIKPDTRMNFLIVDVKKVTNDTTQNEQLVLRNATESDCQSTDGDTLYKGFNVTTRYNVKVTERVTAKRISEDIRTLCQACGIKGKTVAEVIANPSVLIGKIYSAKVGIAKNKNPQYSDSNSFRPIPLDE